MPEIRDLIPRLHQFIEAAADVAEAVRNGPRQAPAPKATSTTNAPGAWELVDEFQAALARGVELLAPESPPTPVVAMIREEAQIRAAQPKSIAKDSRTYQRLAEHYLKDYLQAPYVRMGKAAVEKIGAAFKGPAHEGDYWEESALSAWNQQSIPIPFRVIRPRMPGEVAAATDVLSQENRAQLPYLDVPHLVGKANEEVGADADVTGGGKNISQLMHWATGVKYSDLDAETMRDLFLTYEMWHLEAWDVFGEDPVNDLIAEEQGRIFGSMLRKAEVNRTNLQAKLDESFAEARAWVGSLLKERQPALDAWLNSETQPKANFWWGVIGEAEIWQGETLPGMLKSGKSMDEVRKSAFAQRAADIYALIYESENWQSKHKKIEHSRFATNLLHGKFDNVLRKTIQGERVKIGEALDALMRAGLKA